MLKLTKTGIGLLTKQYRSVLRKCLLINLGAFLLFQENAFSELYYAVTDGNHNVVTLMRQRPNSWWSGVYDYHDVDSLLAGKADKSTTYTKTEVNNIQSLNYYYTKTEADARYALLDTIGDVDYSDEAEDEGSALKNGAEDSPTTVRGALDLLDTKIGSLNETGIAGNDVATQLKYILENGSTGGAGVTLSTLGYIGANTPYLNTTNEAMNFSSTYTIGGNMSTLANQIKTNETNIDNLSSRINSLSSYSGTLDLTDNYAKVIGDVNPVTNASLLDDGTNIKAYAAVNKSYTVEITGHNGTWSDRYFRVQVNASNAEEAEILAKNAIVNGWSDYTVVDEGYNRHINKYMYGTQNYDHPLGIESQIDIESENSAVQAATATVTENNYTVRIVGTDNRIYDADVEASSASEAIDKAKVYIKSGWYQLASNSWGNIYGGTGTTANIDSRNNNMENGTATPDTIEEGDAGYSLNGYSLLENVALLDSAIGDLSATGVSGNSVAAQLKLLGEVGSEALGQKIGSWSTTKDSISQTLGEETKNYGYLTAFEYDSENEQYVGTVGDNLQALDTALSLTAKGLDALSYDLYNYYYTKTEADARYAKLSGGNTFSGSQSLINASGVVTSVISYDSDGGNIWVNNTEGNRTIMLTNSIDKHNGRLYVNDRNSSKRILLEGNNSGGGIYLYNSSNVEKTTLSDSSFKLNGSAISATGIVANTIQNSTALITSGGVYDALNYYYTFRVDERMEMIDSALFFQKDFSTLQKVDLQSKNPTHLGAFTKCDEVCPQPSERFSLSLSQEQMFKNNASVDAGTFSICSLQIENVNEKLSNVFEA